MNVLFHRWLCGVAVLWVCLLCAACGESGSDSSESPAPVMEEDAGTDMTDVLEDEETETCPEEPPVSPEGLSCAEWTCVEDAAPGCWSCAEVPGLEGERCDLPSGSSGVCSVGRCVSEGDLGLAGPFEVVENPAGVVLGGESVALKIFLPGAEGSYPVVIFHHGFQLGVELYASYGQHLASHGFVVVMPQMPGGFDGPNHRELGEYMLEIISWTQANVQVPGGAFLGRGDGGKIALAGHSLGGKISMLAAALDERPLGVFAIDPVDAAGGPFEVSEEEYPSVTPELMDRVMARTVLVGELLNGTCEGNGCQSCAPLEDNFQQYYEHATGPALEIEVLGASHMSFLDNPECGIFCLLCPSGTDDPAQTRFLTQRYMTAFFKQILEGEETGFVLTGSGMEADVAAGYVRARQKGDF